MKMQIAMGIAFIIVGIALVVAAPKTKVTVSYDQPYPKQSDLQPMFKGVDGDSFLIDSMTISRFNPETGTWTEIIDEALTYGWADDPD